MSPIKIILIALAFALITEAKRCRPGNYKLRSGKCLPCPKGTFQPGANRRACKPCPPKKIAAKVGSTKCTACPKNSVPAEFKHRCICIAGFVRQGGKCKPCEPGYFFESGNGYRICSLCSPGYFQPDSGKLKCLKCPAGKVSGYEATKCIKCRKNESFNRNENKCEICKAGYFHEESSGCIQCGANTFKPKPGPDPCLPCPIGTHSKPASKKCTACPKGKILLKNGKCGSCKAGYFVSYDLKCTKCRVNEFTPYRNVRTSCFSCSSKTFAMEGATKCIRCPKNKYLLKDGTCKRCPAGSRHVRYELKCQKCLVNQFTRGDMDYCESCPLRTYSFPGSTTCFKCPKNKALILSKKKCGTCPPGKEYNGNAAKCQKCYEGSIKKERGIGFCKSCPSGMTSNKDRTACVPA